MTKIHHTGITCASRMFSLRAIVLVALVIGGLFSLNQARAAVVQCGSDICSTGFTLDFNGTSGVGSGEILYDAQTGDISVNLDPNSTTGNVSIDGNILTWTMGDGSTIRIDSLSGNVDPVLLFSLGATTASTGGTFAFNFYLPIALEGPIDANSSVSYSLTSGTSAGAQIAPLFTNVVTAQEVDTSVGGLAPLNKGVDVGETFSFIGGPQTMNSKIFTASNSFTGDLNYDLMSVTIAFSLSADSAVGLSGFVSQTEVPVPAAVWLFGSGLLVLTGVSKRKKAA